ncbi:MAG: ribonucrease [Patescibacteria group bacterium]|nr:ribonucrease [Patescibacteria group bacterium]
MSTVNIIIFIASLLIGGTAGYFLRIAISLGKKGGVELEIKQKMIEAKEEAQKIVSEANEKAEERIKELEEEEKIKHEDLKKAEERLNKKDDSLLKKEEELGKEVEKVKQKIEEVGKIKEEVEKKRDDQQRKLEEISRLSEDQAKERLIKQIEEKYEEDFLVRMQKLENTAGEKLERRAKDILATSIQRIANDSVSEMMATTVNIPSEDIKGKIIGKEGRNIRAFERASGVELIVDDTPGSIIVSSFDPVRRQVARVALENLIIDGRIQPAKIEEMIAKAQEDINKIIKQKGEEAVYECGIFNLDPRVVAIVGRLHFRTSYGQNVLAHSVEMAHVAGILAEELGADVAVAKAGALVHDIGKALTHEVQGTHVEIGMRILQKFGTDQKIIDAMKSHHEEFPYETIEAHIVQTADAISGGRPGARSDSAENYIKRLTELESLVTGFDGVDKAYAIAAGREVRVFVNPENITDIVAKDLSRDIAIKIESELKYPGEIKVVVIRENRIINYAR